jgi:hypothetical protein
MVKHVVLFKFKSEINAADKKQKLAAIKSDLEELENSIDCLLFIEVGLNANPAETYDMALTTEFKSFEDLKAYVVHPEHQRVAAVIREILDQRACVDYEF